LNCLKVTNAFKRLLRECRKKKVETEYSSCIFLMPRSQSILSLGIRVDYNFSKIFVRTVKTIVVIAAISNSNDVSTVGKSKI